MEQPQQEQPVIPRGATLAPMAEEEAGSNIISLPTVQVQSQRGRPAGTEGTGMTPDEAAAARENADPQKQAWIKLRFDEIALERYSNPARSQLSEEYLATQRAIEDFKRQYPDRAARWDAEIRQMEPYQRLHQNRVVAEEMSTTAGSDMELRARAGSDFNLPADLQPRNFLKLPKEQREQIFSILARTMGEANAAFGNAAALTPGKETQATTAIFDRARKLVKYYSDYGEAKMSAARESFKPAKRPTEFVDIVKEAFTNSANPLQNIITQGTRLYEDVTQALYGPPEPPTQEQVEARVAQMFPISEAEEAAIAEDIAAAPPGFIQVGWDNFVANNKRRIAGILDVPILRSLPGMSDAILEQKKEAARYQYRATTASQDAGTMSTIGSTVVQLALDTPMYVAASLAVGSGVGAVPILARAGLTGWRAAAVGDTAVFALDRMAMANGEGKSRSEILQAGVRGAQEGLLFTGGTRLGMAVAGKAFDKALSANFKTARGPAKGAELTSGIVQANLARIAAKQAKGEALSESDTVFMALNSALARQLQRDGVVLGPAFNAPKSAPRESIDVLIREAFEQGKKPAAQIADEFGIPEAQVVDSLKKYSPAYEGVSGASPNAQARIDEAMTKLRASLDDPQMKDLMKSRPGLYRQFVTAKVLGQGVRFGTLGGGVGALELEAGTPFNEAMYVAAQMALLDVVMHGLSGRNPLIDRLRRERMEQMAGKVVKVVDADTKESIVVSMDADGSLRYYDKFIEPALIDAEIYTNTPTPERLAAARTKLLTGLGTDNKVEAVPLPYQVQGEGGKPKTLTSPIVDVDGVKVAVMKVNGINVPFYQATATADNVQAGKWYPFFGVNTKTKQLNKDVAREGDYYGSAELRRVAEDLDQRIGDLTLQPTMFDAELQGFRNAAADAREGVSPKKSRMGTTTEGMLADAEARAAAAERANRSVERGRQNFGYPKVTASGPVLRFINQNMPGAGTKNIDALIRKFEKPRVGPFKGDTTRNTQGAIVPPVTPQTKFTVPDSPKLPRSPKFQEMPDGTTVYNAELGVVGKLTTLKGAEWKGQPLYGMRQIEWEGIDGTKERVSADDANWAKWELEGLQDQKLEFGKPIQEQTLPPLWKKTDKPHPNSAEMAAWENTNATRKAVADINALTNEYNSFVEDAANPEFRARPEFKALEAQAKATLTEIKDQMRLLKDLRAQLPKDYADAFAERQNPPTPAELDSRRPRNKPAQKWYSTKNNYREPQELEAGKELRTPSVGEQVVSRDTGQVGVVKTAEPIQPAKDDKDALAILKAYGKGKKTVAEIAKELDVPQLGVINTLKKYSPEYQAESIKGEVAANIAGRKGVSMGDDVKVTAAEKLVVEYTSPNGIKYNRPWTPEWELDLSKNPENPYVKDTSARKPSVSQEIKTIESAEAAAAQRIAAGPSEKQQQKLTAIETTRAALEAARKNPNTTTADIRALVEQARTDGLINKETADAIETALRTRIKPSELLDDVAREMNVNMESLAKIQAMLTSPKEPLTVFREAHANGLINKRTLNSIEAEIKKATVAHNKSAKAAAAEAKKAAELFRRANKSRDASTKTLKTLERDMLAKQKQAETWATTPPFKPKDILDRLVGGGRITEDAATAITKMMGAKRDPLSVFRDAQKARLINKNVLAKLEAEMGSRQPGVEAGAFELKRALWQAEQGIDKAVANTARLTPEQQAAIKAARQKIRGAVTALEKINKLDDDAADLRDIVDEAIKVLSPARRSELAAAIKGVGTSNRDAVVNEIRDAIRNELDDLDTIVASRGANVQSEMQPVAPENRGTKAVLKKLQQAEEDLAGLVDPQSTTSVKAQMDIINKLVKDGIMEKDAAKRLVTLMRGIAQDEQTIQKRKEEGKSIVADRERLADRRASLGAEIGLELELIKAKAESGAFETKTRAAKPASTPAVTPDADAGATLTKAQEKANKDIDAALGRIDKMSKAKTLDSMAIDAELDFLVNKKILTDADRTKIFKQKTDAKVLEATKSALEAKKVAPPPTKPVAEAPKPTVTPEAAKPDVEVAPEPTTPAAVTPETPAARVKAENALNEIRAARQANNAEIKAATKQVATLKKELEGKLTPKQREKKTAELKAASATVRKGIAKDATLQKQELKKALTDVTPAEFKSRVLRYRDDGLTNRVISEATGISMARLQAVKSTPSGAFGQARHIMRKGMEQGPDAPPTNAAAFESLRAAFAPEIPREFTPERIDMVTDAMARKVGKARGSELTKADYEKLLIDNVDKLSPEAKMLVADAITHQQAWNKTANSFLNDPVIRKALKEAQKQGAKSWADFKPSMGKKALEEIGSKYGEKPGNVKFSKDAVRKAFDAALSPEVRPSFEGPVSGKSGAKAGGAGQKTKIFTAQQRRSDSKEQAVLDTENKKFQYRVERAMGFRPETTAGRMTVKADGDMLSLNTEGIAVFNQAMGRMQDMAEAVAFGGYVQKQYVGELANHLEDMFNELMAKGHAGAAAQVAKLKMNIERAAKNPSGDVAILPADTGFPMMEKTVRGEELAHMADFRAMASEKQNIAAFKDLPEYGQAVKHLQDRYPNATPDDLHREVIAKAFGTHAERELNIPEAAVDKILDRYRGQLKEQGVTASMVEENFGRINEKARQWANKYGPDDLRNPKEAGADGTGKADADVEGRRAAREAGVGDYAKNALQGTEPDIQRKPSYEDVELTPKEEAALNSVPAELRDEVRDSIKLAKFEMEQQKATKVAADGDATATPMEDVEDLSKRADTVFGRVLIEVMSAMKSVKSSFDLSAVGRQGLILLAAQPTKMPKAIKDAILGYGDNYSKAAEERIKQHPMFQYARKMGLKTAAGEGQRSELYQSRLFGSEKLFANAKAEKVRRGLGWGIRKSEQSFNTVIDQLRFDTFVKGVNQAKAKAAQEGRTFNDADAQMVAHWVNFSTGYGNLPKNLLGHNLDKAVPFLNLPFYSARLAASRFQVLNPFTYAAMRKVSPLAFNFAMKQLGSFLAVSVGTLIGAKELLGAKVELDDPTSPGAFRLTVPYGKGTISFDIMAGLPQIITLTSRMIAYPFRDSEYYPFRKAKMIGSGQKDKDLVDTYSGLIGRYLRKKPSPFVSSLINVMSGENVMGEPVTLKSELAAVPFPIMVGQFKDNLRDAGIDTALLLGASELMGFSSSVLPTAEAYNARIAELQKDTTMDQDEKRRQVKALTDMKNYALREKAVRERIEREGSGWQRLTKLWEYTTPTDEGRKYTPPELLESRVPTEQE
jgi:hypothetical protein